MVENFIQNTNASTTTFPMDKDFFEGLYSNTVLKQITIAIFFIGSITGILFEAGIIWYERHGNHRYRTAINQLFSTISWLVVVYILFVYIPEGVRYLVGPLDMTYCEIHNFLKNFLWSCMILTSDCIILLRYTFVFKWAKVAAVNDDLIARIFQVTILLLSFWTTAVKKMSVGQMPLNYFMCAGKNPNEDHINKSSASIHGKFDSVSILIGLSLVLHVFVYAKIFLYQRKIERKIQSIQLGCINGLEENLNQRQRNTAWSNDAGCWGPVDKLSNLPKSMADLTTQILCLIAHIIMAILVRVMNQMEPSNLNEYEHRWIVYVNQIVNVAAAGVFVHGLYYARNISVSKTIWRNIKGKLSPFIYRMKKI